MAGGTLLSTWLATLFIPLGISALTLDLGWRTAWLLRGVAPRTRRVLMAALLVPLLLPNYLVYLTGGLLRAPGTWLGEALATIEPIVSVRLGQGLALLSLALWAWPIATFLLWSAVRAVPTEQIDALRLSGAGPVRRHLHLVGQLRAPIVATGFIVCVLMLGSVVPLHLSQVPTLAIDLWARLALDPGPAGVARAWLGAWPLVLAGALCAWLLASRLVTTPASDEPDDRPVQLGRATTKLTRAGLALAWAAAVVLPLLAMGMSIRSLRAARATWSELLPALGSSLLVGAVVGAMLGLIVLVGWRWADRRPGALLRVTLAALLALALVPGVLLGALVAQFAASMDVGGHAPVVIGQTLRFAGLALGAGVLLRAAEPAPLRDARALTAGRSLRAWLLLAVRPAAGSILGLALAGCALSLHEIEVTIQTRPPGARALAQVMLDHLHMNSLQELCAAGIMVLGAGLLPVLAVLTLSRRGGPSS